MTDERESARHAGNKPLLEAAIAQFEAAWLQGKRPVIEEFLPASGSGGDAAGVDPLLWELVHAELEFRVKAGEAAGVEEYLARYPQLTEDRKRLAELVRGEYDLARRRKPGVVLDEYLARFPDLADELQTQLRDPAPVRRRAALRLNCPHCQNPIEIVADETSEELVCPSCGSNFHLEREKTLTWSAERLPKLGKFELIAAVGRGAFGTVYRAKDTQLDRIVAVKLPRSGTLGTEADEDRFIRDARSTAQLRHPGIVPVFEVGRSETFPYIVMEFVEGSTLADVLTAKRLSFRESAELLMKVAEALEHAHQQGVVHRDLKPSNIMLSPDGTPRLMDFGLAKRDAGEITMTLDGQILGTPAYMSPEQAAGEAHKADARSDIYSLGVILYQLLTGELPFRGNVRMLAQQVLHDEPRAPRKLNDRVPRDLETICLKAMAKEPLRRYATAQALADDLRRWCDGHAILARPIGPLSRSWRWARRKPVTASLLMTVLFVLGAGAAVSSYFAIKADTRARQALIAEGRANSEKIRAAKAAKLAIAEKERADAKAEDAERARAAAVVASELADNNAKAADEQRNVAISALNLLVFAVQEELSDVPNVQHLKERLLIRASEQLALIAQSGKPSAAHNNAMAAALQQVGDLALNLGRSDDARHHYERLLQLGQTWTVREPSNVDARRALAVAYERLGNSLLAADDDHALAYFQEAVRVRQSLAESSLLSSLQPAMAARLEWDLSVVQERIGDLLAHRGDLQGAMDKYKTALRIREDQNVEGTRNLDTAIALHKLADTLRELGNLDEAAQKYQQGLEHCLAVLQFNPSSLKAKRLVGISHCNIGELQFEQGVVSAAHASFVECAKCMSELAALDYQNSGAQRDVALANQRLGESFAASIRIDEAQRNYKSAHEYFLSQCKGERPDRQALRDLAHSHSKMAEAAGLSGDLDSTKQHLEQGRAVCIRQLELSPKSPESFADLAVVLDEYATFADSHGDSAMATDAYQQAFDALHQAMTLATSNLRARRAYAVLCLHVADRALKHNEPTQATASCVEAVGYLEALLAGGGTLRDKIALRQCYKCLAGAATRLDDGSDAARYQMQYAKLEEQIGPQHLRQKNHDRMMMQKLTSTRVHEIEIDRAPIGLGAGSEATSLAP